MSAPSSYAASPFDGRTQMELPDAVEAPDEINTGTLRGLGKTFAARYAGQCVACPTSIRPGDIIMYGLDDQLEHAECPEPLVLGKHGACSRCFTEIPLSGVCGVCE